MAYVRTIHPTGTLVEASPSWSVRGDVGPDGQLVFRRGRMARVVRLNHRDGSPSGYAIPESQLATWTDPAGKTADQLGLKPGALVDGSPYEMPDAVKERISEAREERREERAAERDAPKAAEKKG